MTQTRVILYFDYTVVVIANINLFNLGSGISLCLLLQNGEPDSLALKSKCLDIRYISG